jgi:hypothetical protein
MVRMTPNASPSVPMTRTSNAPISRFKRCNRS